jgi:hypothetical protein
MVERPTHNGRASGSNPGGATKGGLMFLFLAFILFSSQLTEQHIDHGSDGKHPVVTVQLTDEELALIARDDAERPQYVEGSSQVRQIIINSHFPENENRADCHWNKNLTKIHPKKGYVGQINLTNGTVYYIWNWPDCLVR